MVKVLKKSTGWLSDVNKIPMEIYNEGIEKQGRIKIVYVDGGKRDSIQEIENLYRGELYEMVAFNDDDTYVIHIVDSEDFESGETSYNIKFKVEDDNYEEGIKRAISKVTRTKLKIVYKVNGIPNKSLRAVVESINENTQIEDVIIYCIVETKITWVNYLSNIITYSKLKDYSKVDEEVYSELLKMDYITMEKELSWVVSITTYGGKHIELTDENTIEKLHSIYNKYISIMHKIDMISTNQYNDFKERYEKAKKEKILVSTDMQIYSLYVKMLCLVHLKKITDGISKKLNNSLLDIKHISYSNGYIEKESERLTKELSEAYGLKELTRFTTRLIVMLDITDETETEIHANVMNYLESGGGLQELNLVGEDKVYVIKSKNAYNVMTKIIFIYCGYGFINTDSVYKFSEIVKDLNYYNDYAICMSYTRNGNDYLENIITSILNF